MRLRDVNEGATKDIALSFFDHLGSAATPSGLTATLYDETGTVIADAVYVPTTPAATMNLVVKKTAHLIAGAKKERKLIIEWAYTGLDGQERTVTEEYVYDVISVVGQGAA